MGAQRKGRCSVGQRWPGAQVVVAGVLAVLAFAVVSGSAGAAAPVREWPPGALDPSFASGGVLTASFANPPSRQEGRDAAVQSDGKIIVLTTVAPPAPYASYLSRYLPNGEPDTTFGSGGTITLPASSGGSALTLDAEGRIVVIGGEASAPWQAPDKSLEVNRGRGVVYRFLPDGSPDPSFGTNGKAVIAAPPPEGLTPGSASTLPKAVFATSDGGIAVGGEVGSVCYWEVGYESRWWEESGTFVARLGPDGSPDSQFGPLGLVSTHGRCKVEPGAASESFSGLVQPSSETVLALTSHAEDNTWRFRTYSPTGALSEAQAPAESEPPEQIAVVGDHYLVLSIHYLYVGVGGTEVLRRFNAQGTPDPSFGTNGRVAIPMACELGPGCFTVLPDGRILVEGRLAGGQVGVRRYLADGSVDGSFGAPPWLGGGGSAWAELPGGNEMDTVNKLLILHGQPLVVGAEQVSGNGYAENRTALTLFQADGGFSSNPPPPTPGEEPSSPIPPPSVLPHEPPPLVGPGGGGGPKANPGGSHSSNVASKSSSSSAIQAALAAMLRLKSPCVTISSLLKSGVCRLTFNAPMPGVLTVEWTAVTAWASRHASHKAKPVVIAFGSKTFIAAGSGVVTIDLTATGRKLLTRSRRLRLVTTATFMSSKGRAVTRRGANMLSLGKTVTHR
jgi:uncharacterized delta-60 repeat protein